jgi:hypothetical protein
MDNLKKLHSKKLFDNFTQTVPYFEIACNENKFTQTDESTKSEMKNAQTQSTKMIIRNFSTQTYETKDVKNNETQTPTTQLNYQEPSSAKNLAKKLAEVLPKQNSLPNSLDGKCAPSSAASVPVAPAVAAVAPPAIAKITDNHMLKLKINNSIVIPNVSANEKTFANPPYQQMPYQTIPNGNNLYKNKNLLYRNDLSEINDIFKSSNFANYLSKNSVSSIPSSPQIIQTSSDKGIIFT